MSEVLQYDPLTFRLKKYTPFEIDSVHLRTHALLYRHPTWADNNDEDKLLWKSTEILIRDIDICKRVDRLCRKECLIPIITNTRANIEDFEKKILKRLMFAGKDHTQWIGDHYSPTESMKPWFTLFLLNPSDTIRRINEDINQRGFSFIYKIGSDPDISFFRENLTVFYDYLCFCCDIDRLLSIYINKTRELFLVKTRLNQGIRA